MARKTPEGGAKHLSKNNKLSEKINTIIKKEFKIKRLKSDLKDFLERDPENFLKKLREIQENLPEMERYLTLQAIGVLINTRLFKIMDELCKEHNIDFWKFLKGHVKELPKRLNVYYKIYLELLKYEEKTRDFYFGKREDTYIIPKLHIEKIGSKYFVLNPENGRWIITENIEVLNKEKYLERFTHEDKEINGVLFLEEKILTEKEKGIFDLLEKAGVIYKSSKKKELACPIIRISPRIVSICVTYECNLACKYCYEREFEQTKENIEKIDETLTKLLTKYFTISQIGFFGGEPLLRLRSIRYILHNPLVKRLKKVIQTNASLVSPEIAKILKIYNVNVGISLDGPEKYNRLRVFQDGSETYDAVLKGLENLKESKVKFGLIGVLHKENVKLKDELFTWIKEIGTNSFHFNLEHGTYCASWKNMLRFFQETFEEYVEKNIFESIYYRNYRWFVDALVLSPEKRDLMCMRNPCGAGQAHVAINPDGSISPCPRLANTKTSEFPKGFERIYMNMVELKCPRCEIRYLCTGQCPGTEFSKEICKFYKKIFPWLAYKLEEKKYTEAYKKWNSKVSLTILEK